MANEMAKRVVARVREIRQEMELTQEAFAERAGLDYKYYQSWEAGRKIDFRFSTLEKLAAACGLEMWQLLDLENVPMILVAEDPARDTAKAAKASRSRRRR